LSACSTDLTDVEKRLDNLEGETKSASEQIDELKRKEPQLLSISFLSKDNSMQLVEDVKGEIIGDSIVESWIKNIVNDKLLIPHFEYTGESVTIDNVSAKSDETQIDFKTPIKLTVSNQGKTKDYTVYVHSFTGLPVLWIETEGRAEITSKDDYLNAHLKLVEDVRTRSAG
jgi:hypothetical protein